MEASQFLANKIEFMIAQGQRSRLMLSNRAIAAFLQYKKGRTIELSRVNDAPTFVVELTKMPPRV